MDSWECQLHSSTNTIQSNSKSLALTRGYQITQCQDIASPFEEKKPTLESSSRENCSGIMGVPLTFLDKYNPDQFVLLGITNTGEENVGIRYKGTPHGRPVINGKEVYIRSLIKYRL